MLHGMTQIPRLSDRDRYAAAFQVYADAIRLGQVPTPDYITLHTAGMTFRDFMALADRLSARITIVEPTEDATWLPYAKIYLPFAGDILPTGCQPPNVHATTSGLTDRMRADIDNHNAWCTSIDLVPADEPTMGAGNVNADDQESLNFADEG